MDLSVHPEKDGRCKYKGTEGDLNGIGFHSNTIRDRKGKIGLIFFTLLRV